MWRRATESLLAILAACALPGCNQLEPFHCEEDAECVTEGGEAGRCEPDERCSFPDPACDEGYRYGSHSGDLADSCVCGAGPVPVGSYSGTVAELSDLEAEVGRPLGLTWVFTNPFASSPAPHEDLEPHLEAGRTVIYNVSLNGDPVRTYAEVTSGALDERLRDEARALAALETSRILVSFDHSPEELTDRGTPAEFRAAWAHWVELLREEGFDGRTALITGVLDEQTFFDDYYPDPATVDVVGSYELNWSSDPLVTFEQEFADRRQMLDEHHPDVPFLVAAYGIGIGHGDEARAEILREVAEAAARWSQEENPLVGISYWDRDAPGADDDFRLTGEARDGFADMVAGVRAIGVEAGSCE